jgi:hypothetical protein
MKPVRPQHPALKRAAGYRVFRVERPTAGFRAGDLLFVVPGMTPEGGEYVIDLYGRLGRHGGGPVTGVVVGAVRSPVSASGSSPRSRAAPPSG